ncbi:hypothetical protein RB653_008308 [Dictyostelium firmibasis]|uniref:Uncharacterized protein n=1 Tax=Dictyostelium firmibasis TaxID=79012 RepID=A0AAN7TZT7_9MYCE
MGELIPNTVVKNTDFEIEIGKENFEKSSIDETIQKEIQLRKERNWRVVKCILIIISLAAIPALLSILIKKH